MSITPSILRFMFVPGAIDSYQYNTMERNDENTIEATLETQINSTKNHIKNLRLAIAVCTAAAIAFVALAITLTSLPTAVILAVPLAALSIIGLLTVQLYCQTVSVRNTMMTGVVPSSDNGSDEDY